MRYVVNDDAITIADYVLEYARHTARGEAFDAETLVREEAAPHDTTIEEYERALRELAHDGKIVPVP